MTKEEQESSENQIRGIKQGGTGHNAQETQSEQLRNIRP